MLEWKLTSLMLLPEAGKAMFEIPRSYILAISGGVRPENQFAGSLSPVRQRLCRPCSHPVRDRTEPVAAGGGIGPRLTAQNRPRRGFGLPCHLKFRRYGQTYGAGTLLAVTGADITGEPDGTPCV